MDIKKCALLLVCLISGHYVNYIMASSAMKPSSEEALPRTKRQVTRDCRVDPEVFIIFERALENIRRRTPSMYPLDDEYTNGIEITGGTCTGWKNFKKSRPIECVCVGNNLRTTIEINYLSILITSTLNFVQGLGGSLLGGALSGLLSTVVSLLDGVTSLLIRVLALNLKVRMVVIQQLVQGANCVLVDYKVVGVSRFSVLGIELTFVFQLLEGLLVPVFDLLLNRVVMGPIFTIVRTEIERISISVSHVQFTG